ncbi:hypothetical protein BDZ91DRAFT_766145 [Kalaharituber pfeilii]|nr:hypothetical protein BDZ91DRAFT_766145 [Kalaharituber pfeilii]
MTLFDVRILASKRFAALRVRLPRLVVRGGGEGENGGGGSGGGGPLLLLLLLLLWVWLSQREEEELLNGLRTPCPTEACERMAAGVLGWPAWAGRTPHRAPRTAPPATSLGLRGTAALPHTEGLCHAVGGGASQACPG